MDFGEQTFAHRIIGGRIDRMRPLVPKNAGKTVQRTRRIKLARRIDRRRPESCAFQHK